jgi:hypothetical protein
MKTPHLTAIIILFGSSFAVSADSDMLRNLKQLKEQRDQAVAAAIEPINRRYQTSLEQLLRRATQGNDLDLALKIKAEIQAVTSETTAPPAIDFALTPVEKAVAGTRWQFGTIGIVEFDRAGNSIAHWNGSKYPIKRLSPDTIEILPWGNTKVAVDLQFNENLTKATITSAERNGWVLERVK